MACKSVNILWEGIQRTETDSFQWCSVKGWEAIGTNWKTAWNAGNTFLLWERLRSEVSCPGVLRSFHPWRYSKVDCTWSLKNSSRWPHLSQGVEQDDLQRHLPTSNLQPSVILWFSALFSYIYRVDISIKFTILLKEWFWKDSLLLSMRGIHYT